MLNPRTSKDLTVRAHADIKPGLVTPRHQALARQKSVRFSICAEYPIVAPADRWRCVSRFVGLKLQQV